MSDKKDRGMEKNTGEQQMEIRRGSVEDLEECENCLDDSQLHDVYFNDSDYKRKYLTEAIDRKELFVLVDSNECKGFSRIDPVGVFSRFPLLRVLAVKKEYRNRGFGQKLLKHYEEIGFSTSDKIFLLVSDFNKRAYRLYRRIGYKRLVEIPHLLKKGVAEYVMMKET